MTPLRATDSERGLAAVDLHMHTTCSDGKYSPQELVRKAFAAGLKVISITDHDNLAAYHEAKPVADELGIELIPGVEVSTSHQGRDVHILGYFVQEDSELNEYLKACRERRILRTEKIVENLRKMGVYIRIEQVFAKAANGSVGRPHIAAVLQESGYVQSYSEAFAKYIGTHSPAYEKSEETEPAEVIRLINEAGGLSFLAHPGRFVPDDTVRYLIDLGIDGLEIIHPAHDSERQEFYRAIANEYFLLMSGGSDYHGAKPQDDELFGQMYISYNWLEKMKNRLAV
ncbi:MAG: PHP domain-containing protein [Chloroherpetonaceae bacterium]|nr:PHP domain-containing protein [Chloroherpetonaceae bacterium]MCS7210301.1 PHP domain-containing protein [Chloroherpetonaceae bacterium]MDW8018530.1 PHP domain-containing protein [Chloroherpetonaceae bacterium]MDW8465289.1 PHP domain-containing protein [Chloroherpetonaceae bacterium]